MNPNAEFDLIVYGASGFTGRLVAEYINNTYGADGDVKWAMAGRSAEKLAAVRDEMGISSAVPLVTADASNDASLSEMVQRAKCVVTTVGPYQLYGEPLVKACAENGTDYVDLCGEVAWMHDMITAHGAAAENSGARIVFSCGFDSIPFDTGVLFLQEEAKKRFGAPATRVKTRVRKMQGTFSGGTAASGTESMKRAMKDPAALENLKNPFSLTPTKTGPEQPHGMAPLHDEDFGSWAGPFVMAPINVKNIHRSNALMAHAYGADFVYDEMMLTGPGEKGEQMAGWLAKNGMSLGGDDAPKPGEGPDKAEREAGHYDIAIMGKTAGGEALTVTVTGDRDPGYGSTSKIITEAGLCLIKDRASLAGGIYTPAPALGLDLVTRLEATAGLTFSVDA